MGKTYRKNDMNESDVKRNKKKDKESRKFRKEKRKIVAED